MCLLAGPSACGKQDESASSASNPSLFTSIQFRNGDKGGEAYGEDQFVAAAKKTFAGTVPKGVSVEAASLTGLLRRDGEDIQLSLSLKLKVKGVAHPAETSLFAIASAKRPISEVVDKGLSDSARAAQEMLRLVRAPASGLVEALSSAELDVQIFAAHLIGASKSADPKAAFGLCQMLGDPRDEAAEAAADALKQIGTPAIVPMIIQSVQRRRLRSEVRAIEVISRIGGKEAEAYLEMTALGHEIQEVRDLSRSLLKSMRENSSR